jgi:hypothetical protein
MEDHSNLLYSPEMKTSDYANVAAILLFCLLVIYLPILIAGFPYGSDQRQHLRFSIAVSEALSEGSITPNWTDDNSGFGEIGIRFYPPFAYVTTAAFHFAVGNWYDAFTLNLIFWMFIGCLGMYLFCREWSGPFPAVAAALMFAIVPYHLTQIYQYFLYAEFAAFSMVPFCFLFLTRVLRGGSWTDVFWLAASYSILVLTHIPLTLICTICMVQYALVVMDWGRAKVVISQLLVAAGLAVPLTAFRLIILLRESSWLAHNSDTFTRDHYSFSSWLFPNVLFPRRMLIMEQVSWLFDVTIILTGMLAIPAIILVVLQLRSKKSANFHVVAGIVISAAFSFFMLSRLSYLVWEAFGFLQKIQFPWRWLSPLSFFAVAGFSLGVSGLIAKSKRWARPLAYSGGILIFAIVLYDITQSIVTAGGQTREQFAQMVAEVHEDRDADYWWPIWAKRASFEQTERVSTSSRPYTVQRWDREIREFLIEPGPAQEVRVAIFYYPYWDITLNGIPSQTRPDPNGTILIAVPADSTRVILQFNEPPFYNAAKWLSRVSWIFLITLLLGLYISRSRVIKTLT